MNLTDTLQQAITHHKAGDLEDAEQLYRSILAEESKHPDANHNLGVLLKQADQSNIALPFFKTALESNPTQGQFWISYIDTLIHLGQLDAAQSILEQGRSKGLKGDAVDQLVTRLNSQPKATLTTQAPSKAIQPERLLSRAKKHANKGEIQTARELYRQVLEAYPKNQQAKKGLKALQKGQVNKKNPSGLPQAQHDALIALCSQGQIQEALGASETLIKDYPNNSLLYNINGACCAGLGQLEAAVKRYEQALAIKPDYADAHNNLGITLQKLGQMDAAVKSYEQALSIKPDYAEAHSNLGITLKDLGQLEAAVKSHEQALAIKPDYAKAHSNLGVTLQELGQLEEAIKRYEQALAIESDNITVHYNLGNTLRELGQLEAAVKRYEQALAIKPDSADVLIHLGIYSWIDQDLDKLKSYITSKMDLIQCSQKSLKFINPYLTFLTRLHNHRLTNTLEYLCDDQFPVIHVIGESHCLTAANSNVEFMGKSHVMRSHIIMGCKAWHLANDQLNRYKKQFETMVTLIPDDGIVLITFGEIDCRLDEGIIKFHQKTKNNLSDSIQVLVNNYIEYIDINLASASRTIIISGVPCVSNSRQQKLSEGDMIILSSVIKDFNNCLKTAAISKTIRFLDIYSLTQEDSGKYFIDDNHLTPSAMVKAMETNLI